MNKLLFAAVVLVSLGSLQAASCTADSTGVLSICTPSPLPVTPGVGVNYTDPDFGAQVTIKAGPAMHQYSGLSPVSKDGTYLHIIHINGGSAILRASTGAVVNDDGNVPYPECHWSNTNDDVCYWPNYLGPQIMRYHVSTNSSDVVIDVSSSYPGQTLNTGATTDISKDEWMAAWTDDGHICMFDLAGQHSYCSADGGHDPDTDYISISRGADAVTGKRYVLVVDRRIGQEIWSWKAPAARPTLEAMPVYGTGYQGTPLTPASTPHGDVYEGSDGQQYFMDLEGYSGTIDGTVCGGYAVSIRLSSGALAWTDSSQGGGMTRQRLMMQCTTNTFQSIHIGAARNQAVLVWSFDADADATQDGQTPYFNTILMADLHGATATWTQIAFHHSTEENFWLQPRAALNFDGSLVVFDSDFETRAQTGGGTEWVALGRTGYVPGGGAPPVIFTSSPLPGGTVGTVYSTLFTGAGLPTWSATGLPPGLSLASSGYLSGTPTASGVYTIMVTAVNSAGSSGAVPFSLTIAAAIAGSAPTITTTAPLPAGTVGMAYRVLFVASGTAPITWSVTGIPPGLIFNGVEFSGGASLSGYPTTPGMYTIMVTAVNDAGTAGPAPFPLTVFDHSVIGSISPGCLSR